MGTINMNLSNRIQVSSILEPFNIFSSVNNPPINFRSTVSTTNYVNIIPVAVFSSRQHIMVMRFKSNTTVNNIAVVINNVDSIITQQIIDGDSLELNNGTLTYSEEIPANSETIIMFTYSQPLNFNFQYLDFAGAAIHGLYQTTTAIFNETFNITNTEGVRSVVMYPPEDIYTNNVIVNGIVQNSTETFINGDENNPPSSVEVIAYDSAGNELISLLQDGQGGNVCFDGGFPKYYNTNWNGGWSTFSQLNASFKLLFNTINFIKNPHKFNNGNNKILFVCSDHTSGSFAFNTGSSGFRTSIIGISNILGLVPTIKDITDYGGSTLNMTLSELNEYIACIMFSTSYDANPRITPEAVDAMVTFRNLGNGLMFITDHGDGGVNSYTDTGFYRTANEVINRFNAYFLGDLNVGAMSIGTLRNLYGDHPLYNNMTNSEVLPAIGSISKVVTNYTTPVTYFTNEQVTADGFKTLIELIRNSQGNFRTEFYTYGKNAIAPFKFVNNDGSDFVQGTPTYNNKANINVEYRDDLYPILQGNIYSGHNQVGFVDITYDAGFNREVLYSFDNLVMIPNTGSVYININNPLNYTKSLQFTRVNESLTGYKVYEATNKMLQYDFEDLNHFSFYKRFNYKLGYQHKLNLVRQMNMLKRHLNDEISYGIPSVIEIPQGSSGYISYNDILSNNPSINSTYHSVAEAIGCTYTEDANGIHITPIVGAYANCGLKVNVFSQTDGYYEDYVFVKVLPMGNRLGMLYNTHEYMLERMNNWIVREVLESLLVRIPVVVHSETHVFEWISIAINGNMNQTQLRNAIRNAALTLGYTFYDDFTTALNVYYTAYGTYNSYIKMCVAETESMYVFDFSVAEVVVDNTITLREYFPPSGKIINQQTTHEFFITPDRTIMYDFVVVQDNVTVQQNGVTFLPIDSIIENDSPEGSSYAGLVTGGNNVTATQYNANTLRIQALGRKEEPAYCEYIGRTIFNRNSVGRQYVQITELDPINAIATMNVDEGDAFRTFVSPPSATTILAQWHRTDDQEYWDDPSTVPSNKEASLWFIDGSGNFVQPNNTSTLNTILSPERFDRYTFQCDLRSNDGDDDFIGMVAAGDYINGEFIAIVIGVHIGGLSGNPRFAAYLFDINRGTGFGQLNAASVITGENGLASRSGWNDVFVRIRVVREGNLIKAYRGDYNATTLNPNVELVVDLDQMTGTAELLRGENRFGFASLSQSNSRYLNYDFESPSTINANRMYVLNTDQRYDYVNGNWTLNGTARAVLDYPRFVINTLTKETMRLEQSTALYVSNDGIQGSYSNSIDIGDQVEFLFNNPNEGALQSFSYNGEELIIRSLDLPTGGNIVLTNDGANFVKTAATAFCWAMIESETGVLKITKFEFS